MFPRFAAAMAVAVSVWLGPAAGPTPLAAAPADARVPFQVGETLVYDAAWSNFLTAGRVTMRVVDRRPLAAGRSGYTLQVEAQTVSMAAQLYRVYYKLESVLDAASLTPVRAASYANERGRERVKSLLFGPNNTADVEIRKGGTFRAKVALPPRALDALSAMYVMRALAAKPGDVVSIPIIDGDEVSKLRLTFGGREMVSTGAGTLPGWRVTPVLLDQAGRATVTRALTVWLSDDALRRPLRFEADLAVGTLTLTLAGK